MRNNELQTISIFISPPHSWISKSITFCIFIHRFLNFYWCARSIEFRVKWYCYRRMLRRRRRTNSLICVQWRHISEKRQRTIIIIWLGLNGDWMIDVLYWCCGACLCCRLKCTLSMYCCRCCCTRIQRRSYDKRLLQHYHSSFHVRYQRIRENKNHEQTLRRYLQTL